MQMAEEQKKYLERERAKVNQYIQTRITQKREENKEMTRRR